MKEKILTCENARKISGLSVMASFGKFPTKKTEREAWFLCFWRSENKASLKFDLRINRWYDHGEGVGGNVIDLVIKIKNCSVKEALIYLGKITPSFSFQQQPDIKNKDEKSYQIRKIKKLENGALIEYLKSRMIDIDIAKKYCKEIYYTQNGKSYFSIAFKNDLDGYELRNKYFKGCIGKKAITFIKNNNDSVCIFEGFIDFLSYKTMYKSYPLNEDYLICNSTALVKSILPKIKDYHSVYACLDNDNSGRTATQFLRQNHSGVFDASIAYIKHKDINEYLMSKVSKKREQVGQGLLPLSDLPCGAESR